MIFASDLRPELASVVDARTAIQAAIRSTHLAKSSPRNKHCVRATARFPDAAFVRLTMPTPASPVYTVRLRQPAETRVWSGVTAVTIDAASGRDAPHLRRRHSAAEQPPGRRRFLRSIRARSAGLVGRLLVMLAGLSLPALYVTGIWAWWRKRQRPKSAARLAMA